MREAITLNDNPYIDVPSGVSSMQIERSNLKTWIGESEVPSSAPFTAWRMGAPVQWNRSSPGVITWTADGTASPSTHTISNPAAGRYYFAVQDAADREVKTYSLQVSFQMNGPTGLTLSASSLAENMPAGSTVGMLATVDPNGGGQHVYSFAIGDENTDNAAFTITEDVLSINSPPDFETKSNYSIRVRTTDQDGLFFEETLAITITDVNEASVLQLPGSPLLVEATSADGALVNFIASGIDPEDGMLTVSCSPPGGSIFPMGDTTVDASVTDSGSLTVTGSFIVRVRDTVAPKVTASANMTVAVAGTDGAVVNYAAAMAADVSGVTSLTYSHASGTTFPLGQTVVTITATDGAQNVGTATFSVTVVGSPETTLFKGYQNGDTYYQRYAFTDWDTPLFGGGTLPDSTLYGVVAPGYRVDGHVILEADGTGYCTVIESTGSYAVRQGFMVGARHPIAFQSNQWFNTGSGTIRSDNRFDKAAGFYNLMDGPVILAAGPSVSVPTNQTAWFTGDGDARDFIGLSPNGILRGDAGFGVGKVGKRSSSMEAVTMLKSPTIHNIDPALVQ